MTATIASRLWQRAPRLPRVAVRAALASLVLVAALAAPAAGEDARITARRGTERKVFTDAEIIKGFFKIAFGAEFRVSGAVDRIRKYEGPVRVFAESRGAPDRRSDVAEIVADIAARVHHLDIAMVETREESNVTVTLVRERDLKRTIRKFYGIERAKQIQRSLDPQCLSGFQKDETFKIVHSEVIVVIDSGEFIFRDCMYEELLQSLGPINDTDIPWTMFNDDVQMGFFSVFDQYILNILYHPRIRPGMTVDEVSGTLPQILPKVRAFVESKNGLAP